MTAGSYVYIGPQGIVHGTTVIDNLLFIQTNFLDHNLEMTIHFSSWLFWTPVASIWAWTICRAKFSWRRDWVEWAEPKPRRRRFAAALASWPRFAIIYYVRKCECVTSVKHQQRSYLTGQLRRVEETLRSRMGTGNDRRCGPASGTRQDGPPEQRSHTIRSD